jgi:hypothetical protein
MLGEMDSVCIGHILSQPSQIREVVDRSAAILIQAILLLIERLRHMRMAVNSILLGQISRITQQVRRDGEGGARRDDYSTHRIGPGIVESFYHPAAITEDRVFVFHYLVGRQPALGLAE